MPRVYIHEIVDIIGHRRADYMAHMTERWGPVGRAERSQLCVGVWAVVGSTGRWPQVVNLWEYEGWDALAHNFDTELVGSGLQDPELSTWWAEAADMRSGGNDRILVAVDGSPSIDELIADGPLAPACYAHEVIHTVPGAAFEVASELMNGGRPLYHDAGFSLVGVYRRAMAHDDEVIAIWSVRSWDAWARFEADEEGPVHRWRRRRQFVVSWDRTLLADAPASPLRTGRQPGDDRPPRHL